eukprot:3781086-Prymnesium_polylepis.1
MCTSHLPSFAPRGVPSRASRNQSTELASSSLLPVPTSSTDYASHPSHRPRWTNSLFRCPTSTSASG